MCRLHSETEKVLGTDLLRCDMNDVTISHALCIEKNIVYYVISFREGWYGFRKPQCGDPEHRITLCEINSIKSDNIDEYIINVNITLSVSHIIRTHTCLCFDALSWWREEWSVINLGFHHWVSQYSLLSSNSIDILIQWSMTIRKQILMLTS